MSRARDLHQALEATFNHAFCEKYKGLLRTTEAPGFIKARQVIAGLALATFRAQQHLRKGHSDPEDICYFAWACRTLLELNAWTRFAVESKQNADALYAELLVDSHEILKSMEALVSQVGPEQLPTDVRELPRIRGALTHVAHTAGITDYERRHMSLREKMAFLGEDACREFDIGFRLLSKFVHPSGLSLLVPSFRHPSELDGFFVPAANYALNINAHLSRSCVWDQVPGS